MSKHAAALASFIGLDEETVKQQIVPYLETFTTRQALINHLEELVGPGQSQRSFIDSYADERFGPVKSEPDVKVAEAAFKEQPGKASPVKSSQSSRKKNKFPSKLPPPRKVEADAFGGSGSVYRKGQEDGYDGGLRYSHLGGKSGASSGTGTPARTVTPEVDPSAPTPSSISQTSKHDPVASVSHGTGSREGAGREERSNNSPSATTNQTGDSFTLISSDEMRLVQQEIALLRGESREDPTIKAKPCFCQGRRHAIHPHVPLCMACGLILCSIQHPSPLLLPSPSCPSCASPILSTTSRAILLTRLDMTLASLTQSHEEKVRLVREERQRAWLEKRKEVELFPDLLPRNNRGGSIGGAHSRQAQEYNHFYERRRAMDVALGRRVEDEAGRKARVIRLGGGPKAGQKKPGIKKKQVKEKQAISPHQLPTESQEGSAADEDVNDVEEEVIMLDYDEDNENNGPMPDEFDDGFALHATSFPPIVDEDVDGVNKQQTAWTPTSKMPSARYIPKEQRQTYLDQQIIDQAEEEGPIKRVIPGSATEAATPISDKKRKGKSKQTQ